MTNILPLRCTGGNADVLGTLQEDAIRNITGSLIFVSWQTNSSIVYTDSNLFNISASASTSDSISSNARNTNQRIVNFNISNVVPTAEENRPINYSVNICIIYE